MAWFLTVGLALAVVGDIVLGALIWRYERRERAIRAAVRYFDDGDEPSPWEGL